MQEMLNYCHMPFVEACRGPPGRPKDQEFVEDTNAVLMEGYEYLKEHFISNGIMNGECPLVNDVAMNGAPGDGVNAPLTGFNFFTHLMGSFERNNIDVEVKHPLEKFFRAYFSEQRPVDETQAFEVVIREKEVVMRLLWGESATGNHAYDDEGEGEFEDEGEEDEMDGDMDEEGEMDEAGMCAAQAHSEAELLEDMNKLRQEIAQMPLPELLNKEWPAFHGTGFSPLVARTNHDCAPNIKIFNEVNDNTMVARIINRPNGIAQGEQLTISYIDQKQNVGKRREILTEYDFVCNCEKCVVEGGFMDPNTVALPGRVGAGVGVGAAGGA